MSAVQCTEALQLKQGQLLLLDDHDNNEASKCLYCGKEYHTTCGESLCRDCLRVASLQHGRIRKAEQLGLNQTSSTCVQCGQQFPAAVGIGRPRKFCGEKCRQNRRKVLDQAARVREKPERTCPICGTTWRLPIGDVLLGDNCKSCRDASGRCLKRCVICGELFGSTASRKRGTGNRKTCSDQCSKVLLKQGADKQRAKAVGCWRSNTEGSSADAVVFPPHRIGSMAEALFDAFCHRRGWQVSMPFGSVSSAEIDRVINRSGTWESVQVKGRGPSKVSAEHSSYTNIKGKNAAYSENAPIDTLAVVDTMTGNVWLIPFAKLGEKRRWRPGPEWDKYQSHVMFDR